MATLTSNNPATGEPVGEVPVTPAEAIADLVARARAAQPAWGAIEPQDRADILRPAAAAIASRAKELSELLTREMGKPVREAKGEILSCGGDALERELADMVEALRPETLHSERAVSTIYRDAYGVCAAITPWNFPFSMPHWMCLPALMAGNAVILKPSEETPLIAQAYVDIVSEVLPDDVLQVVHGADDQGKALVESNVDMIAFTGSRETGKHILGAAAKHLKRAVLELGGKDPLIVLSDADMAKAARFAVRNSFRNAGQVCISTERIYVPEAAADDFVAAMAEETAKLTVGDGMQSDTRVGPMINRRQRDHVRAQIDDAVSRGARLVRGGESEGDSLFLTPAILDGVDHDMAVARDETFGPVACVIRVASDDEAVNLANDTPFGLGAVVFGAPDHAARVARRLTAGMIGVNQGCGGVAGSPWVGARESGYGFHSSRDGHRQFAQTRVVTQARG